MADDLPCWLVENGIGEQRAVQIFNDEVTAARLHWPGRLSLGQIEDARVEELAPNSTFLRRGVVRFANGELAHASRIPKEATTGSTARFEITRESLAERGRLKLAQAVAINAAQTRTPDLAERLRDERQEVREVHRFPDWVDWDEIFLAAWTGDVVFQGGALIVSDTPAMTLIDVDLGGGPQALYFHGVPAIARTLRQLDITGNIGIDFPTLGKKDRKAVDLKLDECLEGWPHERTAMNGFGFVQLVARMGRASILQRISRNRPGAAARKALRLGERADGPGVTLLVVHPALKARFKPEWLDELRRRTGREVRVETDPGLALEAPSAQVVSA